MFVGVQPTAHAWLPDSLYFGSSNGQIAQLDTAAALKQRQQAQRACQGSRFSVSAATAADAPAASGPAFFSMVGVLEFGGQAVHVEAVAVNKDCVAVAGHCPIIRQAVCRHCCFCIKSACLSKPNLYLQCLVLEV